MGLTKTAEQILRDMAPAKVDDLCNALAGMKAAERNAFVRSMIERATEPLQVEMSLTIIEEWWEQKIRTGVMLSARSEEGWLREFPVDELTDDYIASTEFRGVTKLGASIGMGRFLKLVMPTRKTSSRKGLVEVQAGDADGASYKPNTVNRIKRRVRWYEFAGHDAAKRFWMEYLAERG